MKGETPRRLRGERGIRFSVDIQWTRGHTTQRAPCITTCKTLSVLTIYLVLFGVREGFPFPKLEDSKRGFNDFDTPVYPFGTSFGSSSLFVVPEPSQGSSVVVVQSLLPSLTSRPTVFFRR